MNSRHHVRNRFVLIGDVILIIVSVLGSFALRYDVGQMSFYFPAILIMSGVALAVKIPTYYFFGLYRRLWMYASTNELKLIAVAVSTASVLTAGVMLALSAAGLIQPGMPRTALIIDWLFSLVLIGGSRSVWGPLCGAALLVGLPELLRPLQDSRMILNGLVLVVACVYLPRGIMGAVGGLGARLRASRKGAA